jgi:hypothetical protein
VPGCLKGVKAAIVAVRINDWIESLWRSLRDGQAVAAFRRYDMARKRARSLASIMPRPLSLCEVFAAVERSGRIVTDVES